MGNGATKEGQQAINSEVAARWLAIITIGVTVVLGYADIRNRGYENQRAIRGAIEAHTSAIERLGDLIVSDTAQNKDIEFLKREARLWVRFLA